MIYYILTLTGILHSNISFFIIKSFEFCHFLIEFPLFCFFSFLHFISTLNCILKYVVTYDLVTDITYVDIYYFSMNAEIIFIVRRRNLIKFSRNAIKTSKNSI